MKSIFNTIYPVTQKFLDPNPAYKSGVHMGTDYACPVGTPVYAPVDGKIAQTFDSNPSMGNCIIYECVKDEKTYQLRFMHLSACYPVGEYKEGDVIAITGNTGMSEGPHLHVDVTLGPVQWEAIKTKDGVMLYMTDFEVWNQDVTEHKIPSVSPKIDDSKVLPQMSSVVSSKTIWLGFVIAILQAIPLDVLPLTAKTAITTILGILVVVNRFFTTGTLK